MEFLQVPTRRFSGFCASPRGPMLLARWTALGLLCALACVLVSPAAEARASTQTAAYSFTGGEQRFIVPTGVFGVDVVAVGARGGSAGGVGGVGAQVDGEVSVTPGETLYVEVGGDGAVDGGGFNGGGGASGGAAGGGGASDVRSSPLSAGLSPDDRLLVAAGGGGGGVLGSAAAGAGGAAGQAGEEVAPNEGGGAGTLSGGGVGGQEHCASGGSGVLGVGGAGGYYDFSGGGGGGGYYGGGGGGAGCTTGGAGGGGGSSLVPAGGGVTLATANAEPRVEFTYFKPPNPTVLTGAASGVAQTSATLNATVNPEGFEVSACYFEYGTSPFFGSSVPCSSAPGSGTSPVAVSALAGGLKPNTAYYFRIVATNAEGTSYGGEGTFSTPPNPPALVTGAASAVAESTAILNATVDPEGAEVQSCYFEYGSSPAYGSKRAVRDAARLGNQPGGRVRFGGGEREPQLPLPRGRHEQGRHQPRRGQHVQHARGRRELRSHRW